MANLKVEKKNGSGHWVTATFPSVPDNSQRGIDQALQRAADESPQGRSRALDSNGRVVDYGYA
jgi:hypothetical protein